LDVANSLPEAHNTLLVNKQITLNIMESDICLVAEVARLRENHECSRICKNSATFGYNHDLFYSAVP